MKKAFEWNHKNITQYKVNKFANAYTTMKILYMVYNNLDKFDKTERIYIKGFIRQYYAYYKRIFLNDEGLRKILKDETDKAVKENLENIFKEGVKD